jgi:hypothetical protein
MKIATKILIVTLCCLFAVIAKADSAPPTRQTTFYFQKNGQPIFQPVKFKIKCYGTFIPRGAESIPESSELLKVSELSEICLSYGCKFDTSKVFDPYTRHIKYCILEGEVSGQKFAINKFLGENLHGLSCNYAYDFTKDDKYYKINPKYNSCKNAVDREYYPQDTFLCDIYKTDDKLIPTTLSTEPNGPCYSYGYIIKNNICYQIPQAFFECTASYYRRLKECDEYLEDITSKIDIAENGYPFQEICEIKINVPVDIEPRQTIQPTVQPATPTIQPTTPAKQLHKNIFNQIIDFFKCFFIQLFGNHC